MWKHKLILKIKRISWEARERLTREVATCWAHDWNAKSCDSWSFCECLAGKAFLQNTHETLLFAILLFVLHQVFTHNIYPHYPHIERSAFQRENSSIYTWELEIVIPTILNTIHCGFPQLLPFHFHILERLIAQTLTIPILSVKWGFGVARKHWKKPSFGRGNQAYCRIWRARQDTVPRSLVGVGAWRA